MAYLIDTYNLLHAGVAMGGAFSGLTVRKLCQFVGTVPGGMKVTLVMDGRKKPDEPDETEFAGVNFRYSGVGVSADAVIGQLVERATSKKKLTVVTNDRAVALHARKNYANAMSCEAFLKMLLGGRGKEAGSNPLGKTSGGVSVQKSSGSSTKGETEHWMKEFGMAPPTPPPEKEKGPPVVEDPDEMDVRRLLGDVE